MQITEESSDEALILYISASGHCSCVAAGIELWPLPIWLCQHAAIEVARRSKPCSGSECSRAELIYVGGALLAQAAPTAIRIPFAALREQDSN